MVGTSESVVIYRLLLSSCRYTLYLYFDCMHVCVCVFVSVYVRERESY